MSRSRANLTENSAIKNRSSKAISDVRIIGGQFKRQSVPFIDSDGLRPTPDRLREVLFNWVQFDLHDIYALDLCAGSGVLGFETLSRGASYVTFIEVHSKQAKLIEDTASKLKLETNRFDVLTGDALQLIPKLTSFMHNKQIYDLVFIDPPYDIHLWMPLLNQLLEHHLIDTKTLLYIEDKRPLNETLQGFKSPYSILKEKKVGQIFASLIQLGG